MSQPPDIYQQTKQRYPDLFARYEALGEAAKSAGPLDAKTAALAKLAMSMGAGLEGASHGNARKAFRIGIENENLHRQERHAGTRGFRL